MRGVFIILFFLGFSLSAQVVLNGSFEDNTFTPPPWHENGCNFNGDCDYYHNNMAHSNAWETESIGNQNCFIGSIKENCHYSNQGPWGPPAQHGQWSVMIYGLHIQSSWGSYGHRANAISLALSQPLCIGETYAVSYYVREQPQFPNHPATFHTTSLSVGLSEKDTSFGEHIHTSIIPDSIWRWQSVIFEASIPAEHITFKINIPITETDVALNYGTLIDNVSISTDLALAEAVTKPLTVYPNPFANRLHLQTRAASIGLYDLLGKRHHYQRLGEAQRVSLTLDDLPVGMYLLKAYDAQGNEIGQEKVLKMRH